MVTEPSSNPESEPSHALTLSPSLDVNSAVALPDAPSAEPAPNGPVPSPSGGAPARRQVPMYTVVLAAVLIVLVVFAGAYVWTGGFHRTTSPSGSLGTVLLPSGSSYSIVNGQFSDVAFRINSTSVVQGQLNSSEGVLVDVMTPAEFEHMAITLNVSGYQWTSGAVADRTVYSLDVTVAPGQWFLAFLDPNASFPTGVSFYSDLTLTPS